MPRAKLAKNRERRRREKEAQRDGVLQQTHAEVTDASGEPPASKPAKQSPSTASHGSGRRKARTFTSSGDTKEMRDYQMMAAQYPPMSKQKFVETSRVFVKGRESQIRLDEHDVIDTALGGDWSDESIAEHRDAVIEALERHSTGNDVDGGSSIPKDVRDILAKDVEEARGAYELFVKMRDYDERQKRIMRAEARRGETALEKMINHNLTFAMNRVGKMMRRNKRAKMIGAKELIATANVGLVLGARQYDPDSGRAFTTYAAYHVDGQLYDYINREDGNVGIKSASPHEQKQIVDLSIATRCVKYRYGKEPTVTELSSLTNIAPDIVRKRLKTPTIRTQSIYVETSGGGSDDDKTVFIPDLLGSNDTVESQMMARRHNDAIEGLHALIDEMPDEQRKVMMMAYGFVDGERMTTRQIGERLGMKPRQVNAVLNDALARMRRKLEKSDIDISNIFDSQ